MKKDIRAFGYEELQKEVESMGEKAFRAKQIYEWLHVKLADSFGEMTNLSKSLRERLRCQSWMARISSSSGCMTAMWWRAC